MVYKLVEESRYIFCEKKILGAHLVIVRFIKVDNFNTSDGGRDVYPQLGLKQSAVKGYVGSAPVECSHIFPTKRLHRMKWYAEKSLNKNTFTNNKELNTESDTQHKINTSQDVASSKIYY